MQWFGGYVSPSSWANYAVADGVAGVLAYQCMEQARPHMNGRALFQLATSPMGAGLPRFRLRIRSSHRAQNKYLRCMRKRKHLPAPRSSLWPPWAVPEWAPPPGRTRTGAGSLRGFAHTSHCRTRPLSCCGAWMSESLSCRRGFPCVHGWTTELPRGRGGDRMRHSAGGRCNGGFEVLSRTTPCVRDCQTLVCDACFGCLARSGSAPGSWTFGLS